MTNRGRANTSDLPRAPGSQDRKGVLFPLAADRLYRAFREQAFGVLLRRLAQKDQPSYGDKEDIVMVERLAAITARAHNPDPLLGAVFDVGSDLGRYVYGKSLLEDSVEEAMRTLDGELERSGLGGLSDVDVFHRTARARIRPPSDTQPAEIASAHAAFVAGLLYGSLGRVFNCAVQVDLAQDGTYVFALGDGKDVNVGGLLDA